MSSGSGLFAQEDDEKKKGRDFWVLNYKFEALRSFSPKSGPYKGKVYWYLLYTIENKAKQDREYYLSTYAKADTKKTYADVFLPGVERSVERHLRQKRYGQDDRFKILKKRDPSDDRYHYTTIKAGQKLRCIAVFDKLDPNANSIRIDVYGLSNDIREIKQDDGTLLIEERVRVLTFKRLGDEFQIDQDSFKSLRKEWTKKSVKLK